LFEICPHRRPLLDYSSLSKGNAMMSPVDLNGVRGAQDHDVEQRHCPHSVDSHTHTKPITNHPQGFDGTDGGRFRQTWIKAWSAPPECLPHSREKTPLFRAVCALSQHLDTPWDEKGLGASPVDLAPSATWPPADGLALAHAVIRMLNITILGLSVSRHNILRLKALDHRASSIGCLDWRI
jgi:hypothetical protein